MGQHYLRVGEIVPETGHREWDVEHAPDCPFDDEESGFSPGVLSRFYRCDEGHLLSDGGDWVFGGAEKIDALVPGRYAIGAWFSHQPSTPNGPEEWDAGFDVADEPEP